jgi:hypothetical protein
MMKMKKSKIYVIILVAIAFAACSGESAEEKNKKLMFKAISEYLSPMQLDSVSIIDTTTLVAVQSALLKVDSAEHTLDSLLVAIPLAIEKAEELLASHEVELANVSFPMLIPIWEKTIATQKNTIASYNSTLETISREKKNIEVKKRFSQKAIDNANDEIAYYKVVGYANDSHRDYFVSPTGSVLNTKSDSNE